MRSGRTLIALLAGVVALALAAPAANASGRFCNGDTCIRSHDNGLYLGGLEVELFQSSLPGWTQAHVWSSDGRYNVWSRGQEGRKFRTAIEWVFPRRFFRRGARVCAEGFKDGRRIGRPCFTML